MSKKCKKNELSSCRGPKRWFFYVSDQPEASRLWKKTSRKVKDLEADRAGSVFPYNHAKYDSRERKTTVIWSDFHGLFIGF